MGVPFEAPLHIYRLLRPSGPSLRSLAFNCYTSSLCEDVRDQVGKVFDFHFTGKAEHEDGQAGNTLAYIGKHHKRYLPFSIRTRYGKPVYVFCHRDHRKKVTKLIELLVGGQEISNDRTYLVQALGNEGVQSRAWLEITNHFFFSIDKPLFDQCVNLFRTWNYENSGLKEG